MDVCCITVPTFGDLGAKILQDYGILLDGKVFNDYNKDTLEDIRLEELGRALKV